MRLVGQDFFARDTVMVARNLLGKIITLNDSSIRIVETEAYKQDAASHAYRRTARSALMYDTYGHIYVYLVYGMYYCLNFTTEKNGVGAVLIRAAEPLQGIQEIAERMKAKDNKTICSGPGKLCKTLGIDKQFNGLQLGNEIKVLDDNYTVSKIGISSRIGIKAAVDLPWRFFIEGNKHVSRIL